MIVSNSRLKLWRRCKRAHWYYYVKKLQLKAPERPLVVGSLVHEGLSLFYKKDNYKRIFSKKRKIQLLNSMGIYMPDEVNFYLEMVEDAKKILEYYILLYGRLDRFVKVEQKFKLRLMPGIYLAGTIDTVDTRNNLIVDHKTSKKLPPDDFNFINTQSATYLWAAPKTGVVRKKPHGFLWNYIRSSPPAIPVLTKKGELSQQNISTTWEVYVKTLREHGLNPENYAKMKEKLAGKEREFFKRIVMPYSDIIVDQIMDDTINTAKEIKRNRTCNDRTLDFHCEFCPYKDICRADLMGEDTQHLRSTRYEKVAKIRYYGDNEKDK